MKQKKKMFRFKKVNNQKLILEAVKNFLWDAKAIKELGGPIIYFDGDHYILCYLERELIGFMCYANFRDHSTVRYCYVVEAYRRKKLLSEMYRMAEKEMITPIRAIATNMSLPFFLSQGFKLIKENINYHKIQKG
jgi:hypothetical protein